uniref:Putative terminase large subunit n=1 Tax=uncultured marine virus TaxID=186617 RepID=A0A0F7L4I1_9VIRU|nr:putative terminase large subunit [uncultured marine virus]
MPYTLAANSASRSAWDLRGAGSSSSSPASIRIWRRPICASMNAMARSSCAPLAASALPMLFRRIDATCFAVIRSLIRHVPSRMSRCKSLIRMSRFSGPVRNPTVFSMTPSSRLNRRCRKILEYCASIRSSITAAPIALRSGTRNATSRQPDAVP